MITPQSLLADHTHNLIIPDAKTYNDLREGIRALDSISGNYCFADGVEGNIGYQYSGLIPKRPCYLLPVAGWDGKYEWDGNVPKNELPIVHNPDSGVVFSANNDVINNINMNILEAAWKTNLEVRPEKDWKDLKGRAVS